MAETDLQAMKSTPAEAHAEQPRIPDSRSSALPSRFGVQSLGCCQFTASKRTARCGASDWRPARQLHARSGQLKCPGRPPVPTAPLALVDRILPARALRLPMLAERRHDVLPIPYRSTVIDSKSIY